MAPRILICSASVGSGHGRAALAIQKAVSHLSPRAWVRHVDALEYANPLFRRIYGRGYFDLIGVAPHLVRYFYDRLDRPSAAGHPGSNGLIDAIGTFNLRRFTRLVTSEPWDVIISTHFLPPQLIAGLRKAGRVSCPQMIVTTDFDIHRLWVNSPCERYFTATEEGRANLAGWGVPTHHVTASGIPIDPAFSEIKPAADCRRRLGIGDDRPIILQLSGGQGFGPAEAVHRALLNLEMPIEIVSIAGRNEAVRQRLAAIACPARHRKTVIGYTDRMDEYMAGADLIVSKPGGLTCSEALARGAAMVVIEPIPGQEDRNSDFLLESGAAIKVNNLASLPHKVTELLNDRMRLHSMREAAARAGKPGAAFDIARAALELIDRDTPASKPDVAVGSRLSRFRFRRGVGALVGGASKPRGTN